MRASAPRPRVTPDEMCRLILEAERLGVLGPGLAASLLKVSPREAEALIALLEAMGWVEPVEQPGGAGGGCPCARCPLARVCPLARLAQQRPQGGSRVYRVDPKALDYCRRRLQGQRR
ncbi:MAG: hypothetical protein GXO15_06680 [Crenarchaeota archaeon]|nr:hypothetical protein [Thermoproteota archaeon]